ncbi:MAG: trypsin-like peptidase domain-containing protein [Pseudomonadota bacterium]
MSDALFRRLIIFAPIAIAVMWFANSWLQALWLAQRDARAVTPRGELAAFERTAADVFTSTAPSVVYIFTERQDRSMFGQGPVKRGTGSGFVWDTAGHIITNDHVIAGATRVFVRFDSGARATSTIIGRSPDHDLAVLRVGLSGHTLKPIPIGRSSNLRIGQAVFAIGNPFGLSRTLTTGIVSAVDRTLPTGTGREISGVIQTDAAINPGNSGGPLLDSAGRLIGVNTAIVSGTGSYSGIGFAVPVDTVNRIVPQIIQRGRPARPGIGIRVAPEEFGARFGVVGVIIVDVVPGSPAAVAGLLGVDRSQQLLGDVIVAVNGRDVRTVANLATEFERVGVGKTATLRVLRGNRRRDVQVTIDDITRR